MQSPKRKEDTLQINGVGAQYHHHCQTKEVPQLSFQEHSRAELWSDQMQIFKSILKYLNQTLVVQ